MSITLKAFVFKGFFSTGAAAGESVDCLRELLRLAGGFLPNTLFGVTWLELLFDGVLDLFDDVSGCLVSAAAKRGFNIRSEAIRKLLYRGA